MTVELISLVIPVHNEHDNIGPCLERLWEALREVEHEILICYDSEGDTTLPAVEATRHKSPQIRLIKNDLGPGPSLAMRAGIEKASGDVVIVTMADLSDPPEAIPKMAAKIRQGADVVSGSRYMRGGRQIGGPPLKTLLSRMAGLSLAWIAGFGTHDATTSFRAFSRRLLRTIAFESNRGFTLGLEATVKAHRMGLVVDEVPVTWTDRSAGESRFRVAKWLGAYLHWYALGMAVPLVVWGSLVGFGVACWVFPAAGGVPTIVAVVASLATVLVARRLRRRMSVFDVIAVAAWLLPGALGVSVGSPYVIGALGSLSTIAVAWAGGHRRRALAGRPRLGGVNH